MLSEKAFQIALVASLATHAAILTQNPGIFVPGGRQEKKIEVSYLKNLPNKDKVLARTPASKGELPLKLSSKITADKRTPPPFVDIEKKMPLPEAQRNIIRGDNSDFLKPALIKPDILPIKKKITLPPIGLDKINNPSYISYYQIVREKIKRAAYRNYTGTTEGEVTLYFTVVNDGSLADIRLIDEKSAESEYLRNVALKSIKEASPFPVFPKELNYPQLSFNLAITFEIE